MRGNQHVQAAESAPFGVRRPDAALPLGRVPHTSGLRVGLSTGGRWVPACRAVAQAFSLCSAQPETRTIRAQAEGLCYHERLTDNSRSAPDCPQGLLSRSRACPPPPLECAGPPRRSTGF